MSFDLQLVNGDLIIANGQLQTVKDAAKLTQDILKICLTDIGSNPSQPGYGSYLSRSIIGSAMASDALVQIAKSQLNTALTNLQQLQALQVKSFQQVSADEQLAAILALDVGRSTIDPRLFSITIKCITKGFQQVSTGFTVSNIQANQ